MVILRSADPVFDATMTRCSAAVRSSMTSGETPRGRPSTLTRAPGGSVTMESRADEVTDPAGVSSKYCSDLRPGGDRQRHNPLNSGMSQREGMRAGLDGQRHRRRTAAPAVDEQVGACRLGAHRQRRRLEPLRHAPAPRASGPARRRSSALSVATSRIAADDRSTRIAGLGRREAGGAPAAPDASVLASGGNGAKSAGPSTRRSDRGPICDHVVPHPRVFDQFTSTGFQSIPKNWSG